MCGVSSPLWTSAEIEAATGGLASGPFEVTGVTFDSREVGPGDLFVAMPGTVHDGHSFVAQAFPGSALSSFSVSLTLLARSLRAGSSCGALRKELGWRGSR